MALNTNKLKIINFYKEILRNNIPEPLFTKDISQKEINKLIKKNNKSIKLTKKDYKEIKQDIILELSSPKYALQINQTEKIALILKENKDITIDFKTEDIDPAIYYYNKEKMYLINYDNLENKLQLLYIPT